MVIYIVLPTRVYVLCPRICVPIQGFYAHISVGPNPVFTPCCSAYIAYITSSHLLPHLPEHVQILFTLQLFGADFSIVVPRAAAVV